MFFRQLAERIRQRTHNSPQAGSTPALPIKFIGGLLVILTSAILGIFSLAESIYLMGKSPPYKRGDCQAVNTKEPIRKLFIVEAILRCKVELREQDLGY